ncbi:hypothetical protein K1719_005035 [Acacia pycnantha]|nr:hypothetical protein K1719_005035 [Acacia pycnantha]
MDSVLFWNWRGACGKDLLNHLRLVCDRSRPSLIILAETKCEQEHRLLPLTSLGFDGFFFVPSVGRSGGLVAVWRSNQITISVLQSDRQFLHLHCSIPGLSPFLLTGIYATPYFNLKQALWIELKKFADFILDLWVVIGDFNDISSSSERIGGSGPPVSKIKLFNDRISECKLTNLSFVGPKFTWKGPRLQDGARLYERLDRAFSNEAFLLSFSGCSVQVLPRTRP